MPTLILPPNSSKILVIGGLHHDLPDLTNLRNEYDWTIFNGGLFHQPNNLTAMQQLINDGKVVYVASRSDYLFLTTCFNSSICQWINSQPNILMVEFLNRSVLIMDGGLPFNITKQELLNGNLEASFVSQMHHKYNGGLGYVITNNPISQYPQYFNFSMQLGHPEEIFAQEVDDMGLKRLIKLPTINKVS